MAQRTRASRSDFCGTQPHVPWGLQAFQRAPTTPLGPPSVLETLCGTPPRDEPRNHHLCHWYLQKKSKSRTQFLPHLRYNRKELPGLEHSRITHFQYQGMSTSLGFYQRVFRANPCLFYSVELPLHNLTQFRGKNSLGCSEVYSQLGWALLIKINKKKVVRSWVGAQLLIQLVTVLLSRAFYYELFIHIARQWHSLAWKLTY